MTLQNVMAIAFVSFAICIQGSNPEKQMISAVYACWRAKYGESTLGEFRSLLKTNSFTLHSRAVRENEHVVHDILLLRLRGGKPGGGRSRGGGGAGRGGSKSANGRRGSGGMDGGRHGGGGVRKPEQMKGGRGRGAHNQGGSIKRGAPGLTRKERQDRNNQGRQSGRSATQAGTGKQGKSRGQPKKGKVLRGVDGWKASQKGRDDKERGRRFMSRDSTADVWKSARKQVQREKELGAEIGDLVPALDSDEEVSAATRERLKLEGTPIEVHKLMCAYPSLGNHDPDAEESEEKKQEDMDETQMPVAGKRSGMGPKQETFSSLSEPSSGPSAWSKDDEKLGDMVQFPGDSEDEGHDWW